MAEPKAEPDRTIRTDPDINVYQGYLPDEWGPRVIGPIPAETVLERLLLDLGLAWRSASYTAQMTFRTTITDGAYQFGNGTEVRDPPVLPVFPQPGGAAPVPPARVEGVRFGTSYAVEFGRAYEVAKGGELVRTRALAIDGFKRVLPPPPAAPRPVPLPVVPPKE